MSRENPEGLNEVASVTRPRLSRAVKLMGVSVSPQRSCLGNKTEAKGSVPWSREASEPQRSCLGNKTEAASPDPPVFHRTGLNEVASVTRPRLTRPNTLTNPNRSPQRSCLGNKTEASRVGGRASHPNALRLNEVASVTRPRRHGLAASGTQRGLASTKLPR